MTVATRIATLETLARMAAAVIPRTAEDLAHTIGFTPDPWQSAVLHSTAPRLLLNCSRQSGKSTVSAILAVATALAEPNALVLAVNPTLRQSGELFRKCLTIYRDAGRPVPAEAESQLSLTLFNGARIVSLPGKEGTVRGYSAARLLLVDEAARVPTDLYAALRPMLAVSGGRLVALSTPFGSRGWFYDAWRSRDPWERYEVPATACPRISPHFLEEERATLGPWWFEQEYMCAFMDAETQAFSRAVVERRFAQETEAWPLAEHQSA